MEDAAVPDEGSHGFAAVARAATAAHKARLIAMDGAGPPGRKPRPGRNNCTGISASTAHLPLPANQQRCLRCLQAWRRSPPASPA